MMRVSKHLLAGVADYAQNLLIMLYCTAPKLSIILNQERYHNKLSPGVGKVHLCAFDSTKIAIMRKLKY